MMPLKRPEYIRMKLSNIPKEIIEEYKLLDKATPDRSIYIEATKGMYGLPQAGLLPTNSSKNVSTQKDTGRANLCQASGNTIGVPFNSH